MKCKFCGAEIKEGSNICDYCDSEVETDGSEMQTIIRDSRNSSKGILSVIGKVIIALLCICPVVIVVSMIIVFNSDAFKNTYEYSASTDAVYDIPKNETGLAGQIITCDKKGVALIKYKDHTYEDVKILDKDLIEWVNDTERSLDTVGIRFSTDEKGDISELGLQSTGFFIIAKEGERYIAVRDEQVISFTSSTPLETGRYYSGYFSYPDMYLYWGQEESPLALTYMDPKCNDKESVTEQEYYTREDITVYKVFVEEKWYYCSKETYDAVQVGDLLNEYEICANQELAFIVKK